MLKLFLHDMGWKNAPLASDEIYEAKIATTNLPPRHHTTYIYIYICPTFVESGSNGHVQIHYVFHVLPDMKTMC